MRESINYKKVGQISWNRDFRFVITLKLFFAFFPSSLDAKVFRQSTEDLDIFCQSFSVLGAQLGAALDCVNEWGTKTIL